MAEEAYEDYPYLDEGMGNADEYDDYDDGDMDEMEGNSGNVRNPRSKRRSKNDNVGRTFVCGCGKSYLSYPALYTHIKQKHNQVAPEGTNSAQYHSGRGRGRPRKPKPDNFIGVVV